MSGDATATNPPSRWQDVYDQLAGRPAADLSPTENDELATALFWLNDPRAVIEARHRAFQGWQAAGEPERALRSAWHLFYEHWLVGEAVVARGWFERSRRLIETEAANPQGHAAGWLAIIETDVAHAEGRTDEGRDRAIWARSIGDTYNDADLVAMGLQAEGRMLVALGDRERGLARLDDAMVSVIGNELDPLFTGWVYCNVIGTCHGAGDLRRANEWSAAALRWCESIRDGLLYPGLCRVYSAELAQLRGDWDTAEAQARQACDDLAAYDPRYAAYAYYVLGDLCRLRGRLDEADASFSRARELGHPAQPGGALLQAASGDTADALAVLRAAADAVVRSRDASVVGPLQLLTALIDVAEIGDDGDAVRAAASGIAARAGAVDSALAQAYAASAAGRVAARSGETGAAVEGLTQARDLFDELDMPFETARQRQLLARALDDVDDPAGARHEREAAAAALEILGVPAPTDEPPQHPDTPQAQYSDSAITELSAREREVLALAAGGLTNKAIADALHLSPHTVARHMANILTKLGVGSRAAAASVAVAAGLSPITDGQD